jgi:hypothetical protein
LIDQCSITTCAQTKSFKFNFIIKMTAGALIGPLIEYAIDQYGNSQKYSPNKRLMSDYLDYAVGSMAGGITRPTVNLRGTANNMVAESERERKRRKRARSTIMQIQGTKDMILGPYRKKVIGIPRHININQQLKQLVDDTKVFKQNFKLKIKSDGGLRDWVQIVCRQRATPGTNNAQTTELWTHGKLLKPNLDVNGEILSNNPISNYWGALPPVPRGELTSADDWNFVSKSSGPGTENLFFLNMPLTYLEQDMFNMGLGPGVRAMTHQMKDGKSLKASLINTQQNPYSNQVDQAVLSSNGELVLPNPLQENWAGTDHSRLTDSMQVVHPKDHRSAVIMQGAQQNASDALDLTVGSYPFRMGWGINMLDYAYYTTPAGNGTADTIDSETPSLGDPQWLKNNNSANTIATIKNGSLTFTFNNLGESQCYVTTLIVVNKHVDKSYWSMPEALTDTYIKAAQNYIYSGEWSITNNITNSESAISEGQYAGPYMYVTHPTIKPFGKVPTQFLKEFNEHFTIKYQTTQKLGIGERTTWTYNLGGLQYTAESIAMDTGLQNQNKPVAATSTTAGDQYYPAGTWPQGDEITDGVLNGTTHAYKHFPKCCQQGTTHVLFGLQGMALPYVQKPAITSDPPDVSTVKGRWASPAVVDISGSYTEVIAPLSTKAKRPNSMQKTMTFLPPQGTMPIITTMPRIRTTNNGAMEV